jgi:hypothetical protein
MIRTRPAVSPATREHHEEGDRELIFDYLATRLGQ